MTLTPTKHADYICLTALYKRGWTPAMIREAELTPAAYTKNPHGYPAEQKLFRTSEIVCLEHTEWFHKRKQLALRRAQKRIAGRPARSTSK